MNHLKKQKGFSILSVIIFMAVIIATFSVWVVSGSTNAQGQMGNDKNKLYAASIINDGAKLKLAFDTALINGGQIGNPFIDPQRYIIYGMAFNNSPYNILSNKTGIKKFEMSNTIFRDDLPDGFGVFVYNAVSFKGNVGTNAPDSAMLLYNIKDSICKTINQINNGTDILPSIDTNINEMQANWQVPISSDEIDLTNIPEISGWVSGCINIKGGLKDHSMYFRILKVN